MAYRRLFTSHVNVRRRQRASSEIHFGPEQMKDETDIIIRLKGLDCHLHKHVLRMVSPVFRTIIDGDKEAECIDMTKDSGVLLGIKYGLDVWKVFLQCIYPGADYLTLVGERKLGEHMSFCSNTELNLGVAVLAHKFDVQGVYSNAMRQLTKVLPSKVTAELIQNLSSIKMHCAAEHHASQLFNQDRHNLDTTFCFLQKIMTQRELLLDVKQLDAKTLNMIVDRLHNAFLNEIIRRKINFLSTHRKKVLSCRGENWA